MSQTKQQEQRAAPVNQRVRRDWEPFWRIVAGLMLLTVAWVVWVLYQITPRSVVTPLAYASVTRPITRAQAPPPPSAPQRAAEVPVEDYATGLARAAARSGAHQPSADVQTLGRDTTQEPIQAEGLRLATELSTPLAEKPDQTKPEGAAPAAAGKNSP